MTFGKESRLRREALAKMEEVMATEHELLSLGGQAAAAAHSLGTPLSTIKIITQELAKQFKGNKDIEKDIPIICCIEKNHSMPKQGVKSTWTFGYNSGAWEGILCSFNIPYILTPPLKWMRHYSVPKLDRSARKKYLKNEAVKLYPHHKKIITLATADAVLIARYAVEKHIK